MINPTEIQTRMAGVYPPTPGHPSSKLTGRPCYHTSDARNWNDQTLDQMIKPD